MKNLSLLILAFLFSILTRTFGQNYADVQGTWSGNATLVEKLSGEFWTSERHIVLNITDNKVTGTVKYSGDVKIGPAVGHDECFGAGSGELISVNIRTWDSTYDINMEGPECKLVAGGGNSGDGLTGIGISNKRLQVTGNQLNTIVLSGTETTTRTVEGMGEFTRTITWHLVASVDAELIVTPIGMDKKGVQKSYNDWLPEPGTDETTKGSLMKIGLKLQSKSGKPLKYKAQSFELKLSSTSREPGITINYPVRPAANQLPDLRFVPLPIAESDNEDQSITVTCKNGTTGEAFVASYDGGGWTTLTAVAKLEGGIYIEGHLQAGDTNILIPKRNPALHIAEAWFKKYGNPGEMDDKETSAGNNYNGDGLTAYEEYRGVIAQEKFKRLDPGKKEVGIDVVKNDLPFFSDGIKRFEKATGLTAVIFHQDLNEIDADRRMNKNGITNHSYDQYVLRLDKSVIPSSAVGKAYGGPGTPAKTRLVVVDYTKIQNEYGVWQGIAREMNMPMPFTLKEQLASVIAHELGHGVSCWHHGRTGTVPKDTTVPVGDAVYRIFSQNGRPEIGRPYPLKGDFGIKGSQESGDISCIMTYCPYYDWAYKTNGRERFFYRVPLLPLGNKICNSGQGTGINKKDVAGNNNYFGDASFGNCEAQINLRN